MIKILKIEGMMCGHCSSHVEKALRELDGVSEVVVSLEEKTAKVTMDKEISDDIFKNLISKEGYEVVSVE